MFTRPLDAFDVHPVQPGPIRYNVATASSQTSFILSSFFSISFCETLLSSARIFQCDIQEINRSALDKDTELPFFWAYVDSADPTSCIVKVPMHCYYGDRGALAHARMAGSGADCHGMRQNAPGLLASMDKAGAVGFEYHIRARPVADSSESHPPVIRLMRPGLVPKTGNVMGTGAHCTNLLQPGTWSGRLSVNLVLPWLINHLTDPQSGHGPARVASLTLEMYNETQVCKPCFATVTLQLRSCSTVARLKRLSLQATISQEEWVSKIHPEFRSESAAGGGH